ncbi:sugar ABC transporter substrate-binding protein [Streptomonospora salina]|uniref:Multiple sugar transport system substrate-binding protein n=1 Tax=Streptomonospora salina TaxID=104205 RepID=A0A841EG76_9ACTN|nr:extracellular solute-binding protein [Streptomonospora salina]MBB5999868.1 multiple sugar transport system substrate-binding protein [Streptomonospora salina]
MHDTRRTSAARCASAGLAAATLVLATACSSSGDGGAAGQDTDTYTWWDPYPQHTEGSDWAERVNDCGEQAGVQIERTASDTTDLTNRALLAAQEGNSPDVILLDNPAVPTLADTGMLASVGEIGLEVGEVDENLLAAGVVDDETYGIPIGANTLAIYYNAEILDAAGVDPESVTDWQSLTDALARVTENGDKGITFAATGTEEGSFQFLPWFWGSGADLRDLDSPEAVEALELWDDWLAQGYAPESVINNSQNTTWEEFSTGEFGFAVNGTWQVDNAAEADFDTGVIQIPAQGGGTAPAPTGGEFIVTPLQSETDRYDVTRQIVECMTTPAGFVETATTFAYYVPPTAAGQEELLQKQPELDPWVQAVRDAKGRTSDNLGTDYPKISEPMWTAVQNALSGSATPAEALKKAQADAEAATGR